MRPHGSEAIALNVASVIGLRDPWKYEYHLDLFFTKSSLWRTDSRGFGLGHRWGVILRYHGRKGAANTFIWRGCR